MLFYLDTKAIFSNDSFFFVMVGSKLSELPLGPMEIQFTSDTSTFDRGFKLRYDVIGRKTDINCGETNLPLWPRFSFSHIFLKSKP